MLWSPTVGVLLLARLVDGFAVGLAVTLVPVYISETAPPEVRGLLSTLPQLTGSTGMFLSYCMVFAMTLAPSPNWRVMMGVLVLPSLVYVAVTVFFLPESPRWLVSKGRMKEARVVLRMLRGREDVDGEMALLAEGLGAGGETAIEEYIVGMDWDEENAAPSDDDDKTTAGAGEDDVDAEGLRAPLLDMRTQSSMTGSGIGVGQSQATSTMGIGGGWQLAWKWTEDVAPDGTRQSAVQRMYLHEEPGGDGQHVHAAALVNQSALYSTTNDNLQPDDPITPMGPAMVHPASCPAAEKPRWRDLLEPGVRHALVCGVTIQILQQFSGISGILYYTPQILDQAGVSVLLSNLGLTSDSAAILISGLTTLLMLPAIAVAMRLMDVAGRRSLLLWTIPVLIVSLVSLVTADVLPLATTLHAAVSTTSIIIYICTFVMGFGPIPGILCSEIFPTRVRGMCIAICSLAFWLSNIAVTYSMPVMLDYLGLTGVFSIYAAVCCVALAFVALRVPETKGLPLEVIAEFFNVASKGMPKLDHDE
uniref:Monosaccharide-sensing protein 2 n=1 Tax=Aegilops tauschii TaxID=37682 RepID=N1QRS3_AEGTA